GRPSLLKSARTRSRVRKEPRSMGTAARKLGSVRSSSASTDSFSAAAFRPPGERRAGAALPGRERRREGNHQLVHDMVHLLQEPRSGGETRDGACLSGPAGALRKLRVLRPRIRQVRLEWGGCNGPAGGEQAKSGMESRFARPLGLLSFNFADAPR